jgi:FlaA1/EpsC-like NDP-sugar epimerase
MRRRLRSAAPIPFHRHVLPQIVVDGVLVAIAYYLAFQLRFDEGLPHRYRLLMDRTIWWVALGGVGVLVLARVYLRSWSYSGQRDYEAILRGVLAWPGRMPRGP